VTVQVDGQRRDIQYLPQGPAETLPSVRVVSTLDCSVL